jgi:DNA-binding LacI/PurR family transcriptional regulator
VIISPTRETDTPCHELVEANIPVVSVDRRILDLQVDTVVVDNVGASFELTSHLIQNGHQRIGAVFGPQGATTGRERREGYVRALEAHGLPLLPHLVRSGMPKEALGHQFAREVLDLPDPPTALYAGNNLLAIGAIKAIAERGLRIPEDVALASFDEMDWTTLVQPALTVVAQPTYELGRTAAALLLERIRDGARPIQTVTLKPRLIVRESCARHGGRRRLAQKQ